MFSYTVFVDRENTEARAYYSASERLVEGRVVRVSGPPNTEIDGMSVVITAIWTEPTKTESGTAAARPAP